MSAEHPTPDELAGVGDELRSLECEICGDVITGAPSGRGSVVMRMGAHRWTKHKIKGEGRSRVKGAATVDDVAGVEVDGPRRALAAVKDIQAHMPGKGAPSAEQLAGGLGRGIGLVTMGVAVYFAETDERIDPGPEGDAERDRLVDYLSLSDRAAKDLCAPFGRLIAPTKFNVKHGRKIVENADAAGAATELGTMFLHYRKYFRDRAAALPSAPAPVTAPGFAPAPDQAAPVQLATPAPMSGRVMTAEDVKAAQRRSSP